VEPIESADGTSIAIDRSGSGPPLVIVLGAFCDRMTNKPLSALLRALGRIVRCDAGPPRSRTPPSKSLTGSSTSQPIR
jgi:hypothetical protein